MKEDKRIKQVTFIEESTIKTIFAISGIVLIEVAALFNGIDGVLLGASVGALAGLGGYTLGKLKANV